LSDGDTNGCREAGADAGSASSDSADSIDHGTRLGELDLPASAGAPLSPARRQRERRFGAV